MVHITKECTLIYSSCAFYTTISTLGLSMQEYLMFFVMVFFYLFFKKFLPFHQFRCKALLLNLVACICYTYVNLFQFKRYVNKLRGKSNIYKKKRQEMAELKTECGILSRTVDILQQKESALTKTLVNNFLSQNKVVSGFVMAL